MNRFHALSIALDGAVSHCDWDPDVAILERLQLAVDGDVDVVSLTADLDMWVNDEGIVRGMPINVVASFIAREFLGERFAQPYFGPVVFTGGVDDEGETLALASAQIAMLSEIAEHMAALIGTVRIVAS